MRIYPQLTGPLVGTVLRDVFVVALLLTCWAVGQTVYEAVRAVEVVGRGVELAGDGVQDGFSRAGDAVDDTPVVGDRLGGAFEDAGSATGGRAADAGREGQRRIKRLATVLGWSTGGVPAALMLLLYAPRRYRQVRMLTAAERMVRGTGEPERDRMLAMRAAFSLPYDVLLRHTRDPFGDLAEGRLEPLHAAVLEEAGLRPTCARTARAL